MIDKTLTLPGGCSSVKSLDMGGIHYLSQEVSNLILLSFINVTSQVCVNSRVCVKPDTPILFFAAFLFTTDTSPGMMGTFCSAVFLYFLLM